MSQWTHVCGCIRIDGLEMFSRNIESGIRKSFGNTYSYEDNSETQNNCTVPYGREGSVQYNVVKTGTENSMSWGLIYIWGDLRDYSNYNEIYEWIKSSIDRLNNENLWVRNCAVLVEVEFSKSYFIFDELMNDTEQTVSIKEIG